MPRYSAKYRIFVIFRHEMSKIKRSQQLLFDGCSKEGRGSSRLFQAKFLDP